MKRLSAVLLMSEAAGKKTQDLAIKEGVELDAMIVDELDALQYAFFKRQDLLLSFGTSVIVPQAILESHDLLAINVHAAPPQYPGRDPHHFAIYDGVTQYGATLHYMTQRVDSGPIIDVEYFDISNRITPFQLLALANEASWILIKRLFNQLKKCDIPQSKNEYRWNTRKTTRKMFLELCRIDKSMDKEEIDRRYKATDAPGYNNLFIDIHGYRFRIDKPKV